MNIVAQTHVDLLTEAVAHLRNGDLELAHDRVMDSFKATLALAAVVRLSPEEDRARTMRITLHDLISERRRGRDLAVTRAQHVERCARVEKELGYAEWARCKA